MVRAPCCDKMGLKKGPWTREEDQILIDYIQQYGHGNWRALPKEAGLLRCGKSCRLRWTNYLRPDIKRGNFTKEEEDTIINLHAVLGNRWSAIAARLPGRTDNEIKNVWNTHLRKRALKQPQPIFINKQNPVTGASSIEKYIEDDQNSIHNFPTQTKLTQDEGDNPNSPQTSSSDISSVTSTNSNNNMPEWDEILWSDLFPAENSTNYFPLDKDDPQLQISLSPLHSMEYEYGHNSNVHGGVDFWFDLFTGDGELPELLGF